MYKGFINDVMNARDTTFLYIVESPGSHREQEHEQE